MNAHAVQDRFVIPVELSILHLSASLGSLVKLVAISLAEGCCALNASALENEVLQSLPTYRAADPSKIGASCEPP